MSQTTSPPRGPRRIIPFIAKEPPPERSPARRAGAKPAPVTTASAVEPIPAFAVPAPSVALVAPRAPMVQPSRAAIDEREEALLVVDELLGDWIPEPVVPRWRPLPRVREVGVVETTLPLGSLAPYFWSGRSRRCPKIVGYADVRAPMCAACEKNPFRQGRCADPECCKQVARTYEILYPRLRRYGVPTEGREFRLSKEERDWALLNDRDRGRRNDGRKPRRMERWAERSARALRSV